MRLGILADTHGLLRPGVLRTLAGCDHLLHAGDVGSIDVLEALEAVAPVDAVRGNVDLTGPPSRLPATIERTFGPLTVRMTHRREDVPETWLRPAERGLTRPGIVVFGHSHRPELEWHGRLLLLNPGAAGARRFHLPATVARVTVVGDRFVPELLSVED